MICPEFPPVNTTGNYRSAGFAREFSKAGHEVQVITTTVDSGIQTFNKSADEQLLLGLESVKIHRFPIRPISDLFKKGIGNALRIWWNTTDNINKRWYFGQNKKKINDVTREFKPDILYISLPPFSCYSVALDLHKNHQVKLVTDMRDAWSLWATSPYPTRYHYKKVKRLEHSLFSSSTLILGVTNELVNDFKSQHKDISANKFRVVFNGYDAPPLLSKTEKALNLKSSAFKIGYVGSFYYDPDSEKLMSTVWYKRPGLKKFWFSPRKEYWVYRSPYKFLLSMALHNQANPDSPIQFEFVGKEPQWLGQMVKRLNIEDYYVAHGFKPKAEVLRLQQSWNGILATSEKIVGSPHFCLPSKSFDYVNAGKPIFAFITDGAQKSFFKDYPQVVLFEPDEVAENAKMLESTKQDITNIQYKLVDSEYSRERQSQLLLKAIQSIDSTNNQSEELS